MNDSREFDTFLNEIQLKIPDSYDVIAGFSDLFEAIQTEIDEDYYNIGISFSKRRSGLTDDISVSIFDAIVEIYKRNALFQIFSSYLISHLAAISFKHFVNKLIPQLLNTDDENLLMLGISISRIIINPCSGFLNYAPLLYEEFHGKQDYDFFSPDSDDLNTDFGETLTKFRKMIFYRFEMIFKSDKYETKSKKTMFSSSFLTNVQSLIVPPEFRNKSLGCGFPARDEVLYAISKYQTPQVYSHDKISKNEPHSDLLKSWSDLFTFLTSFKSEKSNNKLEFFNLESANDSPLISLMKLVCFTNPGVGFDIDDSYGPYIFNAILCDNPEIATFTAFWIQSLILIYPSIVFCIFDEIFRILEIIQFFIPEQLHTYIFVIARILDILCCLPERYLTRPQCIDLHCLTIMALASPYSRIRLTAIKLAINLDRCEVDQHQPTIIGFIKENQSAIERHMLSLFEAMPAVNLWKDPIQNMSVPDFFDVMAADYEYLWQLVLSCMFYQGSVLFSQQFMNVIRSRLISFVQFKEKSLLEYTNERKLHTINLLTCLAAIGQTPMQFSDHTNSEDINTLKIQSEEIVECIINECKVYISTHFFNMRIVMSTVSVSLYPKFIPYLMKLEDINCIIVAMNGFAWNPDFCAICENEEFLDSFLELYEMVNEKVNAMHITPHKIVFELEHKYTNRLITEFNTVKEYLAVTYKILYVINQKYKTSPLAPFPCCELTIVTEEEHNRVLQEALFFIVGASLMPYQDEPTERLHFYAIHCLSLWFSCCQLEDKSILNDERFMKLITSFSNDAPDILFHLLFHHMSVLLPYFLESSISEKGTKFFLALCQFFKASCPLAIHLSDTLLAQWASTSSTMNSSFSQTVSVLADESGNFIAACIINMSSKSKTVRDSSFLLLASIAPLLLTYHDRGPSQDLTNLLASFLRYSSSVLTIEAIQDIIEVTVQPLSFCIEQIIDRCLDAYATLHNDVKERVIFAMLPLINSITLDLENRVVSSQSDIAFMKYSCCSFIEKLLTVLTPYDQCEPEDSIVLSIWPSLALRSNFEFILLALIGIAASKQRQQSVIIVISTLYQTNSTIVLDCLCKHLSFMYWLHSTVRSPSFTSSASFTSNPQDIENLLGISNTNEQEDSLNLFIMQAIVSITSEYAMGIISYLPIIFANCVINFAEMEPYLHKILINMETQMGHDAPAVLHDLIRIKNRKSEKLAYSLYKLLLSINSKLGMEFGLEILRWGLCCGDIAKATCALRAYKGFLFPSNITTIGLITRTLWILSRSLREITLKNPNFNFNMYADYFAACLEVLHGVAAIQYESGIFISISTIFWISVELLNCNAKSQSVIFEAALNTLEFFFERPAIFSLLTKDNNHPGESSRVQLTKIVFWKFHQPWNDTFSGIARTILEAEFSKTDMIVKVLNLFIQTRCPLLWGEKDNWLYTLILALIPWMWKVVTTDMNRNIFTSSDVRLLDETVASIKCFITDEQMLTDLELIAEGNDINCYQAIQNLCESVFLHLDTEDIELVVCNFYTTLLENCDKNLKIPLYTVATWIIEKREDAAKIVKSAWRFIELMKEDMTTKMALFVDMFMNAIKKHKLSFGRTDVVEVKPSVFPSLLILERIVVVDVPHLYDITVLNEMQTSCEDLNSFLPMCPIDPVFSNVEVISQIKQMLEKADFPPFNEWSQLINKGMTFLLDADALSIRQPFDVANIFQVSLSLSESVSSIKSEYLGEEDMLEPNDEINETQESVPDKFFVLGADAFLPTMDIVNETGQDLFEHESVLY